MVLIPGAGVPDDGPKTDKLLTCPPPEPERVPAVLFSAAPGRPGELVLTLFVGGRLVAVGLELSAGDRVMLADAVAAVPERPSRAVSRDQTVRRPPPG